MHGCFFLLFPLLVPILAGMLTGILPVFRSRKPCRLFTGFFLAVSSLLMLCAAVFLPGEQLVLWHLTESIPVQLRLDGLSRFYLAMTAVMWALAGFYSFEYMNHEKEEHRFQAFFLITQGVLSGLTMAGNLVTLYMFYEAMTLMTLPLVLHSRTKEAIAAGIKYLVYSVFGASAALLGIFFLNRVCVSLSFVPGGNLKPEALSGTNGTLLAICFLMILGFGTKAGMFPLHGWLPTAHPEAPAPASAVLSGVITKMGVLGILRVVYYCVGASCLRGTWVQTAWMVLTLITVFMGSMLALREDIFKKRLAYSSVSQVSYVLFGLSTLTASGLVGALLHILFHSAIKITLFMTAGAVISKTGLTRVSELRGIGKRMPFVFVLFTVASLGLIGIPPTGGFVSKWYLAAGALDLPSAFSIIGPATLLLSAILTAAYLLPVSINGFLPGQDFDSSRLTDASPSLRMTLPMLLLSLFVLLGGMFPSRIIDLLSSLAAAVLR